MVWQRHHVLLRLQTLSIGPGIVGAHDLLVSRIKHYQGRYLYMVIIMSPILCPQLLFTTGWWEDKVGKNKTSNVPGLRSEGVFAVM